MFARVLAIALSGLALNSAAPAPPVETFPSPYTMPLDLVVRIECDEGTGTGSFIDAHMVVTVSHVASLSHCSAAGQPLTIAHNNGEKDFAVLISPLTAPDRIPVSCDGIRQGRVYYAIGFAHGNRFAAFRMIGTGSHVGLGDGHGLAVMRGRGMPGVSGGPVLDAETGFIVAVHTASNRDGANLAYVRELRSTYLCGAPEA